MNGGCPICIANCVNAGKDLVGTNCPDCIPEGSKTGNYTVTYHPEGWRSAKDEKPEKAGAYIVAIQEPEYKRLGLAYFYAGEWLIDHVTHWQPMPTAPWDIMPCEQ